MKDENTQESQSSLDWLKNTAATTLGIDPAAVRRTSVLAELGVDSLAQLKLVVLAEEELGAPVPDAALTMENLHSLETLAATIDAYRK